MRTPDILFLNGTSSSGKTTLAKSLQRQLADVYLHVPLDSFGIMFPESKLGNRELCFVEAPKLRTGFYRSVAALVECGNKVIVDTVANQGDARVFKPFFSLFDVVYVGVKCPLEELERRELARGDRNLGLARSQFMEVHQFLSYEIEVDTYQYPIDKCAVLIKQFLTYSD